MTSPGQDAPGEEKLKFRADAGPAALVWSFRGRYARATEALEQIYGFHDAKLMVMIENDPEAWAQYQEAAIALDAWDRKHGRQAHEGQVLYRCLVDIIGTMSEKHFKGTLLEPKG